MSFPSFLPLSFESPLAPLLEEWETIALFRASAEIRITIMTLTPSWPQSFDTRVDFGMGCGRWIMGYGLWEPT